MLPCPSHKVVALLAKCLWLFLVSFLDACSRHRVRDGGLSCFLSTQPVDVERLFARYGRIVTCKIKSEGYGFVVSLLDVDFCPLQTAERSSTWQEFEDIRDAEDAIRALDG